MAAASISGRRQIPLSEAKRQGFMWGRKWQPTPAFLPGKSHGQRSSAEYSPRGHRESGTAERLHFTSPHGYTAKGRTEKPESGR